MVKAIDHALPVRRAVVARLKATAALTSLVSAARIYGEQPPAQPDWPFIRYGFPITTPFEAARWSGSAHRLTIHAFAKGPHTDAIHGIAAAIVESIVGEADEWDIPGLGLAELAWVNTAVLRDTDEANAYHAVCEFDLIAVRFD